MSFLLEYLSDEERTNIEQRMKKICEGFQTAITSIPEVDENGTTNGHVKTHKKVKELKMAQPRRSPRKSKPVQSYSPIRSIQKTPNKLEKTETTQNGRLKRKVVIPATPDETVIKKCKSEPALMDKEVVAETPAEQTRKRCKILYIFWTISRSPMCFHATPYTFYIIPTCFPSLHHFFQYGIEIVKP